MGRAVAINRRVQMITIRDNTPNQSILDGHDAKVLYDSRITKESIGDLLGKEKNLLVYPPDWKNNHDSIGANDRIINMTESGGSYTASTGNIMGFFGVDGVDVCIRSRFDSGKADYFMHYMLCKVFCPNVIRLDAKGLQDSALDMLVCLLPYYLKQAFNQGIYREYVTERRNDANVKGPIDIARHIRRNMPFAGRIAYNVRLRADDNPITELVRHTVECVNASPLCRAVLNADDDTKFYVMQIRSLTKAFNRRTLLSVVQHNVHHPVRHPYYTAWRELQMLCLAILQHQGVRYCGGGKKVYGILFDGATLWEEYLATLLGGTGFTHANNRTEENGINLFRYKDERKKDKDFQMMYPDFYIRNKVVADAKYSMLDDQRGISGDRAKDMYYKTLTYMMRLKAHKGLLLYPHDMGNGEANTIPYHVIDDDQIKNASCQHEWTLQNVPFNVPAVCGDWEEFKRKMKKAESDFMCILL